MRYLCTLSPSKTFALLPVFLFVVVFEAESNEENRFKGVTQPVIDQKVEEWIAEEARYSWNWMLSRAEKQKRLLDARDSIEEWLRAHPQKVCRIHKEHDKHCKQTCPNRYLWKCKTCRAESFDTDYCRVCGERKLIPSRKLLQKRSVNELVVVVAEEFLDGGGYNNEWTGSGSPVEIRFMEERILSKEEGGTYCSGYTFAVGMRVAEIRGLLKCKSVAEVRLFQMEWFGSTYDLYARERQAVAAIVTLGIGSEIPAEEAEAGDFVQFWRIDDTGHSVVFKNWIKDSSGQRIGIRYRGSQGKTDGIGEVDDYFYAHGGRIDPNRMYFGRFFENFFENNQDNQTPPAAPTNLRVVEAR